MATLALAATPADERLLADLTEAQRAAVTHDRGPLLLIAGAGTGKTTVITRRIVRLIGAHGLKPDEILALTFTEKAAAEMEERVDLLLPYGYVDLWISTFHAFGDRLLREHGHLIGLPAEPRVLSKAEQLVFLRERIFDLPLEAYRPLADPTRYVEAIASVIGRAKDEAVTPEEWLAHARAAGALLDTGTPAPMRGRSQPPTNVQLTEELARTYEAYQRLLREAGAMDFGDQVLLLIQLFERHPELLRRHQQQFKFLLVDEFQDTNYAQFRLLQLLAPPGANITVVADDDQSIYKWRGAAISNVLKFIDQYQGCRRIVLTENFRSTQPILDSAYRLIRFNDPDRLEVKEGIDKRLIAAGVNAAAGDAPDAATKPGPKVAMFDTVSSEADWVARQIQAQLDAGTRRPGDFAILVRSNRDADMFLRALNVAGIPWSFSGSSSLFSREEGKLLLSCLTTLADPDDTLSHYHVLASPLYACPMDDLMRLTAKARYGHRPFRAILADALEGRLADLTLSDDARRAGDALLADLRRLTELARTLSPGQLLYRWLTDTGWLKRLAAFTAPEDAERLQAVARFFDQLHRLESLVGNRLPELMASLDVFRALGDAPGTEADAPLSDRVSVLTLHKAKGLEFPVVFLVGLVQGRFPTPHRRDTLELPEALIKDLLPAGDYHLQEERRLFYVGMTRAKEELVLAASYSYGGKSVRKISQFVLEAMALKVTTPPPALASPQDRIARAQPHAPMPPPSSLPAAAGPLRLDAHGADDYLTCPLKYRFSHVLKLPIMRHPPVIYGTALHKAIEAFFTRQLAGRPISREELLAAFEAAWSSEGFLSKEHETRRLAQGQETLRRFFAQQQAHPEQPSAIEEKFSFRLEDLLIVGRIDRVDRTPEGAVIIDYKSSDVRDQDTADKKTKESLQLAVYALAWQALHEQPPVRVELRFLETGLTGTTEFTDRELEAAKTKLRKAADGIRAGEFQAQPSEFSCRWCAYQTICPSALL